MACMYEMNDSMVICMQGVAVGNNRFPSSLSLQVFNLWRADSLISTMVGGTVKP